MNVGLPVNERIRIMILIVMNLTMGVLAITDEDFFTDNSHKLESSEYLMKRGLKSSIQCPRMSSLFREETLDGKVIYHDIDRFYYINIDFTWILLQECRIHRSVVAPHRIWGGLLAGMYLLAQRRDVAHGPWFGGHRAGRGHQLLSASHGASFLRGRSRAAAGRRVQARVSGMSDHCRRLQQSALHRERVVARLWAFRLLGVVG